MVSGFCRLFRGVTLGGHRCEPSLLCTARLRLYRPHGADFETSERVLYRAEMGWCEGPSDGEVNGLSSEWGTGDRKVRGSVRHLDHDRTHSPVYRRRYTSATYSTTFQAKAGVRRELD